VVIAVAVRWYLRYGCPSGTSRSYFPSGIEVDHVTIYR
jgi:hypothetical protein